MGIVNSNCGGNFGIHLKRAGYDALIITGKAKKNLYTWLLMKIRSQSKMLPSYGGVSIQKNAGETSAQDGKIVIGPAGENLVRYACIVSQERVAGRGGVGTVMGSKNLKAVVAGGTNKIRPANVDQFKETTKKWRAVSREHPATGGRNSPPVTERQFCE